ncbi:MAG: hypothetical protein Kow0042_04650 [Calditrichia bacterium]
MHARASVHNDPLFKGMYQWAVKDSEGKLAGKCIVCHSPLSIYFNDQDLNADFNKEGVTCQTCHGTREIAGFRSARDLVSDFSTIYSSHPPPDNEAHPVAHRDFFENGDICLPCHAEMSNPRQIPVCQTGYEWRQYYQNTQKSCVDCHMGEKDEKGNHVFQGTHRGDLLPGAVDMQCEVEREARELRITLTNIAAGHAIPTGTPLRMVLLKVAGYDKNGNLIWENWEENPMQEDTSALFMKILGDAEGNGPVPPWKATQILFDRKLLPRQPLQIIYEFTDPRIQQFRASLLYRFAPLPILRRLGITDPHFTEAKLISQKTVKISSGN